MPRIISIQLLVNDFGNLGSHIQQAFIYPAVQNMLLAARTLYLGATLTRCFAVRDGPRRRCPNCGPEKRVGHARAGKKLMIPPVRFSAKRMSQRRALPMCQ
jgi:hypothetical protein